MRRDDPEAELKDDPEIDLFGSFADIRWVHQARRFVEDIFKELESDFLKYSLRSPIVGMVPGIDFG